MTRVASYLSKKVGRRAFWIKDREGKPPQQKRGSTELFASGDELSFCYLQPEKREPGPGSARFGSETQMPRPPAAVRDRQPGKSTS